MCLDQDDKLFRNFIWGKGIIFQLMFIGKLYVRYDMVHMELCLSSIEALCIILINMYLEAERVPSLLTLLVCHLDINIFTII